MTFATAPAKPTVSEILIVDDTPANLRLLANLLSEHGYKVRMAPSGRLALLNAQADPPDLILLDILMPDMDGFEVCRRLKTHPHLRDIPIIFISALNEAFDKVTAFDVGGVDYITKPFQVEEVLARVQTHLRLRAMQQSLEEQNQELEAYAHTVAHDLKNPVSVILGFAAFSLSELEDSTTDRIRGHLTQILNSTEKLSRIIDELLLLASIRQMDEIDYLPLDMGPIVAEALNRLAPMIEEYDAEIIVPENAEWPLALGYPAWIEEVWANYVSNAIKYGGTPPLVELGGTVQTDDQVCFWVRDNGPGLTPDEQAQLFAEFTRLKNAGSGEGHGLGLSIVKRIIDKLGGEVAVESEPGYGSMFSFTLPLMG